MFIDRLPEYCRDVSSSQTQRELASVSLESRNLPDVYTFKVSGDKLTPPDSNSPIEWAMSTSPGIDRIEFDAFVDIQIWACSRSQGLVFWLSPPDAARSLQAKVIVSQLIKDQKSTLLENRALLFDTDQDSCVTMANNLAKAFFVDQGDYQISDEVRRQPIFINHHYELSQWLPLVENIINAGIQWQMVASGEDKKVADEAYQWASGFVLGHRQAENMIGSNPLSCPLVSASKVMQRGSQERKFIRNCGKCGMVINAFMKTGDTCASCGGVYLGC